MSWSRREALVGLGAAVAGCAARQVPRRVLTCEDVDPTLSRADCRALTGDRGHVEADAEGASELRALLVEHARRYPRMEPADVFKLCHQRRMGPLGNFGWRNPVLKRCIGLGEAAVQQAVVNRPVHEQQDGHDKGK